MKKLIILYLTLIFTAATITAQNYGLGNTDPSVFTKYRVPETSLSSLYLNTNFIYNSSNYISKTMDAFGEALVQNNDFQSNLVYNLTPRYYYLNEKDDRQFSLSLNILGEYSCRSRKQSPEEQTLNDKSLKTVLDFSTSYLNYPSSGDLFFSMASIVNVNIEENNNDISSPPYNTMYSNTKIQDYNVLFGLGFGKIRNVTSVVTAIRIQERLKQLNLLNSDLPENAINDLAQQLSKSSYYSTVYTRNEKYFWKDVEDVLAKDGVSLKGLNQYSSSYLHEALSEVRFLRREGFIYGINTRLYYSNIYNSEEDNPYKIHETCSILGNAYLEYSHQLNLNSQIRGNLTLSGGPNLINVEPTIQDYEIGIGLGYDYELTDRFVISVSNDFSASFYNQKYGQSQRKIMSNEASLSLNYFIEDQIAVNATYSYNYYGLSIADYKTTTSSNDIQIGINYYFNRGFIIK